MSFKEERPWPSSRETSSFTSNRFPRQQLYTYAPCWVDLKELWRSTKDESTKNYPWSTPSAEEKWHTHAESVLMVALTTLNLRQEAWKSARLLRAVSNCRLVLMLSYHMLSPALSVEENGLMAYLQTPPEAGPSIVQVTSGLQNWKCAGRRLVEIGGRLPTATQLHQLSSRY